MTSAKGPSAALFYDMIDILKIAEALTKAGKIEEAKLNIKKAIEMMQTIKEPPDERERTESGVWQMIAIVRAQMLDINGAFEAESAMKDSSLKPRALFEIAKAQIRSGDLKGAQKTAKLLDQDPSLIRDIAIAQAKSGDLKGALSTSDAICCTVKNLGNAKFRGEALRVIASDQVDVEGGDKALEWAQSHPSSIERTYALLGVAEGLLHQKRPQ